MRCIDVLRETRNRVRIGEEMSEMFWTDRGIRQGCPLSPGLFNLLTADLEEYEKRELRLSESEGGNGVCTNLCR